MAAKFPVRKYPDAAAFVADYSRSGDLLITIYASGDSGNVVRVLAWARDNGLMTIALSGFSGGRSAAVADISLHVAAENLISSNPAQPVLDTHFSLEGPVVAQIIRAFADDWFFMTRERLTGERWFPPLAAVGGSVAWAVTSGPAQAL